MTSPIAMPATSAASTLYVGPWYRRSPFFEKTLAAGCSAYDIYNHMYLPGYCGASSSASKWRGTPCRSSCRASVSPAITVSRWAP